MPVFCTHCGALVRDARTGAAAAEPFDADLLAKSGILRLRPCGAAAGCGAAASDAHVERDGALVLVDLVLGARAAYRHVLLNDSGGYYARVIWKMALLALICDGYIGWAGLEASKGEFFEQEFQFYGYCGTAFLGKGSKHEIIGASPVVCEVVVIPHKIKANPKSSPYAAMYM